MNQALEDKQTGRHDNTYMAVSAMWLLGSAVLAVIIGRDLAAQLVAVGTGLSIQAIQWAVIKRRSKKEPPMIDVQKLLQEALLCG